MKNNCKHVLNIKIKTKNWFFEKISEREKMGKFEEEENKRVDTFTPLRGNSCEDGTAHNSNLSRVGLQYRVIDSWWPHL